MRSWAAQSGVPIFEDHSSIPHLRARLLKVACLQLQKLPTSSRFNARQTSDEASPGSNSKQADLFDLEGDRPRDRVSASAREFLLGRVTDGQHGKSPQDPSEDESGTAKVRGRSTCSLLYCQIAQIVVWL